VHGCAGAEPSGRLATVRLSPLGSGRIGGRLARIWRAPVGAARRRRGPLECPPQGRIIRRNEADDSAHADRRRAYDAERERLSELERTVATGLEAAVAAGRALRTIRKERLFREHGTFKAYLAVRRLSQPYGYTLTYIASVADVLEDAGESPAGSGAALRELVPVLNGDGPAATVAAFRAVADDGTLPPVPETRRRLVEAGVVDRPKCNVSDSTMRRSAASR
jgi:hypothetical protein